MSNMAWGISEKANRKEKLFADINDTLQGFNSTTKIDYKIYCELYDELRKVIDLHLDKDGFALNKNVVITK